MMELSETQGLCTSLVAAFLLGCGATATPAAQAPSSPPSAMLPDRVSARSLSLYVNPSANANVNAFRAMIMEHLVKLGYTVTDAAESADVTIDMAFAVSANKPVFFRGARSSANIHVTLTAEGQGLVLGGAETDVTFGEQPSSSQMDVLCSSLMSSPRFAEYAAKRKVDSAADVPGTTTAVDASTLPGELAECDGNECAKGNPGTWIFHATTGVGRQPNGAVYDLTITRFDGDTIEIHRVERPNSAAPGLTAVYTGHLRSGRFEGTFTAKWPGHFPNMKPRDVISGSWFATAPSTTCAPDPGIQDAKEAGALAARFEHLPQALQCFRKAAEKGDGPAKAVVGLMYRDGIGTIPNTAEALKWLQSAATQEEYNAQVALAQMYAVGIDGSPPDRAKADAWRDRALHNPAYVAREEAAKRQERAQQMMFMGLAAVVEAMAAPTVYVRSAW